MANYFQIVPPLDFSHRLFIFTNRGERLELEFEERLPRKTASIFKEGIGQEPNGAANQEKQIFLLCQISPSASSTRDLGTRLDSTLQIFTALTFAQIDYLLNFSLARTTRHLTNFIKLPQGSQTNIVLGGSTPSSKPIPQRNNKNHFDQKRQPLR